MHDPLLYSQTVHELNSIVMGNNFTPVVASRNYTYANIAAYEVIAAGDSKKYTSISRATAKAAGYATPRQCQN